MTNWVSCSVMVQALCCCEEPCDLSSGCYWANYPPPPLSLSELYSSVDSGQRVWRGVCICVRVCGQSTHSPPSSLQCHVLFPPLWLDGVLGHLSLCKKAAPPLYAVLMHLHHLHHRPRQRQFSSFKTLWKEAFSDF